MPRQFGVPEDVIQNVMAGKLQANAYSSYMEPIHDKHVIGINNAFKIGNWIDVVFFGDCAWYVVYRIPLASLTMLKVTCCTRFAARNENESRDIKFLSRDPSKPFGINNDPTKVCWNNNSGAAAISLAAHFGVKRIILLGFDMSLDGAKVSHWHGSHHIRDRKHVPVPPFARHLKGFQQISEDAKVLDIEILNASSTSAITVFPKVEAKDFYNESSYFDEAKCAVGS